MGWRIPSGWRFGLEPGIRATSGDLWSEPGVAAWGYPELVNDPDHVNALFERDPAELAVFESHLLPSAPGRSKRPLDNS